MLLALLAWLSPALALPADAADDRVLAALAEDRATEAVRLLERAVAESPAPTQADLQCLLGLAHRQAGDPAAAIAVWSAVPETADCAPRAAFDRADLLLSQGQAADAASVYDTIGASLMGPDRDRDTLVQLLALADDNRDQNGILNQSVAESLYPVMLGLQLSDERRYALATTLATEAEDQRWRGLYPLLGAALTDALDAAVVPPEDDAAVRRQAARLLGGPASLVWLAPVDDGSADHHYARATVLHGIAPTAGVAELQAAVDAAPERLDWRHELATRLTGYNQLGAAEVHLVELVESAEEGRAADASYDLLQLTLRRYADPRARVEAIEPRARDFLSRFPDDARHNHVERWLADARLDAARDALADGDPDTALARYTQFIDAHSTHPAAAEVALETALAAWRAGQRDDARQRLNLAMSQSLGPRAVALRFDLEAEVDPERALAWLSATARGEGPTAQLAAAELVERERQDLLWHGVSAQHPLGLDSVVELTDSPQLVATVQNLDALQLRVHPIDAEALLRAGGDTDSLPALDVAVIAPEREWTVALPGGHPGVPRTIKVDLPRLSPGLYAVTADTGTHQARVVVRVGDGKVLAHAVRDTVVVGVLNNGQPERGARVLLATHDRVLEGRTDRTGLARFDGVVEGAARVLSLGRGGPSLAQVGWTVHSKDARLHLTADLDRPVVLPADTLGVRVVARQHSAPVAGAVSVWLDAGGVAGPVETTTLSTLGDAAVELAVPDVRPSSVGGVLTLKLRTEADGAVHTVRQVGLSEEAAAHTPRLTVWRGEDGLPSARVTDAAGAGLADWPVEVRAAADTDFSLVRTDAAGRVPVELGPRGFYSTVTVRLLNGQTQSLWPARAEPLSVSIGGPSTAPGQRVRTRVEGAPGVVSLVWEQVLERPKRVPSPLPGRAWDRPDELVAADGWRSAERDLASQPTAPHDAVPPRRVTIPESGHLDVVFDGLPPGDWVLWAVRTDAHPGSAVASLMVTDTPILGELPFHPAAGDAVSISVPATTLLVAEAGEHVTAQLTGPTATVALPPDASSLHLDAITHDGRHERLARPIKHALDVALNITQDAEQWSIEGTVSDPRGLPSRAQVALRVVDTRLITDRGRSGTRPHLLAQPSQGDAGGAHGGPLSMRTRATAVSAALLADARRSAERERARAAARDGRFQSSGRAMMEAEAPMEELGLGSFGTGAGGGGASGYGSGRGRIGTRGQGKVRRAAVPRPAHRERVLWAVLDVDAGGRFRVDLPAPPAGTWQVEATALARHHAGHTTQTVQSTPGAHIFVPPVAAVGADETVAVPVTVWTDGDTAIPVIVEPGGHHLTLQPDVAQTVLLPPAAAGSTRTVTVSDGAKMLASRSVSLPVTAPARAEPNGRQVRVAVGPSGTAPLLLWAREEAAASHTAGATARAGRIALAAHRAADTQAATVVAQMLQRLRLQGISTRTAIEGAEVVAFLAEVRDAGVPVQPAITDTEVEAALAPLPRLAHTSRDRVALQWARVVAGVEPDRASLGRLVRESDRLDPDDRAWLARVLLADNQPDAAAALIQDSGPHAILARRAVEPTTAPALPTGGLPPVAHPLRAHAALAVAGGPGRASGTATVRVDGVVVGTLNLVQGQALHLDVSPSSTVTIDDAPPGVVIERGEALSGEASVATARAPHVRGLAPVSVKPSDSDPSCGAAAEPCVLAVGDALQVAASDWRPGAWAGGGLVRHHNTVTAVLPGRFMVSGARVLEDGAHQDAAPVWVEVVSEVPDAHLPRTTALAVATAQARAGQDPRPTLAPWPDFDDWEEHERAQVTRLRWDALAESATAADRVAAFEALRDADPTTSLALAQVAAVARAYAAHDKPRRAVEVWRAGLGVAFLQEAAAHRRLEDTFGRLASMQSLTALPNRYPDLPVVAEAEFHLPQRLLELTDAPLPTALVEQGLTHTDLRLAAAAWDRRFLATHPRSELVDQAGFHLAQNLLRLDAHDAALDQAVRTATRRPDTPLRDALALIEGLALAELGQDRRSHAVFTELATGLDWPQPDGSTGPAALRADARYALARLAEAAGRYDEARDGYAEVAGTFTEAAAARDALQRVIVDLPDTIVLPVVSTQPIQATVAQVDEVFLRAYALDLRTVFLRDGGLDDVSTLQVDGVSPAWSGSRRLRPTAYATPLPLRIPLRGAGAWLVQADADGARDSTLVVRSDLTLDVLDGPAGRRVVVLRRGLPAAGVEVRARVPGGAVEATQTDLRGVALVSYGAAVLATDGDHVAFTAPAASPPRPRRSRPPAPAPQDSLDKRIQLQRKTNAIDFEETYQLEVMDQIDAEML